jgi:ABC-type multidrug transport system ATPase subunit
MKINNLTKTYKNGVKALDNLNLEIGTGMFGLWVRTDGKVFINANYFNATKPDSGSIEFDGINVLEDQMGLRKILGYLPQEFEYT